MSFRCVSPSIGLPPTKKATPTKIPMPKDSSTRRVMTASANAKNGGTTDKNECE